MISALLVLQHTPAALNTETHSQDFWALTASVSDDLMLIRLASHVSLAPLCGYLRLCRLEFCWCCCLPCLVDAFHYVNSVVGLYCVLQIHPLHLLQSPAEVCECVRLCVFVRRLCTADLCVLFQNESPTTSRQSPANGHSSINSSILVRTPTPNHKKTKNPSIRLPPSHFPHFFFSFCHAVVSWYFYMSVSLHSVAACISHEFFSFHFVLNRVTVVVAVGLDVDGWCRRSPNSLPCHSPCSSVWAKGPPPCPISQFTNWCASQSLLRCCASLLTKTHWGSSGHDGARRRAPTLLFY